MASLTQSCDVRGREESTVTACKEESTEYFKYGVVQLDGPSHSKYVPSRPTSPRSGLEANEFTKTAKPDIPILSSHPTSLVSLANQPTQRSLPGRHFPQSFLVCKTSSFGLYRLKATKDGPTFAEIRLNDADYSSVTLFAGEEENAPLLASIRSPNPRGDLFEIDLQPLHFTKKAQRAALKQHTKDVKKAKARPKDFEEVGELEIMKHISPTCHEFNVLLTSTNEREAFYWESCIIKDFQGLANGYGRRLLREKTGEIVGAFGRSNETGRMEKYGDDRMVFLGDWETFGQDLEIMAFLTGQAIDVHARKRDYDYLEYASRGQIIRILPAPRGIVSRII